MKKIKMGLIAKILLPLALKVIGGIVKKATPEIRVEVEKFVLNLEEKASATPNDIDDILVKALKGILGI